MKVLITVFTLCTSLMLCTSFSIQAQLYAPEIKVEGTNGRIGINTTNYKGIFNVSGGDVWLLEDGLQSDGINMYMSGQIYFVPRNSDNTVYLQARRSDNSGSSKMQFNTYNNGSLIKSLHIDNEGNIGLGTDTPQEKLEVVGSGERIIVSNANEWIRTEVGHADSYGGFLRLTPEGGASSIFLRSYGYSYINGGNLGVGYTNPQYKLHVNGPIVASNHSLTSDEKLKENIQDYSVGLAIVKEMKIKKYKYKRPKEEKAPLITPDNINTSDSVNVEAEIIDFYDQEQIGVLAQQIEQLDPSLVGKFINDEGEDILTVNHTAFTYLLVNAVKELNMLVESLAQEVQSLKDKQK